MLPAFCKDFELKLKAKTAWSPLIFYKLREKSKDGLLLLHDSNKFFVLLFVLELIVVGRLLPYLSFFVSMHWFRPYGYHAWIKYYSILFFYFYFLFKKGTEMVNESWIYRILQGTSNIILECWEPISSFHQLCDLSFSKFWLTTPWLEIFQLLLLPPQFLRSKTTVFIETIWKVHFINCFSISLQKLKS